MVQEQRGRLGGLSAGAKAGDRVGTAIDGNLSHDQSLYPQA